MPRISVVGHPFDVISQSDFISAITEKLINKSPQFTLSFANPEHIITFRKNKDIQRYTHQCLYCVPDGMGVVWASRVLRKKNKNRWLKERITGTDFSYTIAQICSTQRLKLFIYGGKESSNSEAIANLKKQFPHLLVRGINGWDYTEEEVRKKIHNFKADVVMVCLYNGMQEPWIERNRMYLPNVKLLFGNGGAVDFIAGKRTRAPDWMHGFGGMGLEWMWRFFQEISWKKIRQVIKIPYFMLLVFLVKAGLLNN